jgi:hypothetical protein
MYPRFTAKAFEIHRRKLRSFSCSPLEYESSGIKVYETAVNAWGMTSLRVNGESRRANGRAF